MAWVILLSGILNLFLGLIVWIRNVRDRLNTGFWIFSLSTVCLILLDFYFRFEPSLLVLRSSYAFAALVPITALVWILEICKIDFWNFSFFKKFLLIFPGIFFFALPYADGLIVKDIFNLTILGYRGELGPLFGLYSFYFIAYIGSFFFLLYRADKKSRDRIYKLQIRFVLLGIVLYGLSALTFSLILPKFFGVFDFTLLDAPSLIFFVGFTAYAILKLHLFNIKVIATELLVFALSIFILVRTILSDSFQDQLVNGGLFIGIIVVGTFLIRSVLREVEQREKIESLAKDLEETNQRQEQLIHFIGHEVKGYLTKGEYAFSELVEGDYGKLSTQVKTLSQTALGELRKGVKSVTDILKAANLKRGTVSFDKTAVDLKDVLKEEFIKLTPAAEEKGLQLKAEIDDSVQYTVSIDRSQFAEHVIRNLMDNSIKYTPTGSVTVGLSKKDGKVIFSVKDTGVGISDEDKPRLFTEGGHGKDSMRVNVHSTGYGLYIAKNIVDAHGGKIWAESDGPGKGSAFFVELPSN